MPLVSCPDCGSQISTAAIACPRCGRPTERTAPATPPPLPFEAAARPRPNSRSSSKFPTVPLIVAGIAIVAGGLAGLLLSLVGGQQKTPDAAEPDALVLAVLLSALRASL